MTSPEASVTRRGEDYVTVRLTRREVDDIDSAVADSLALLETYGDDKDDDQRQYVKRVTRLVERLWQAFRETGQL